MSEIFKISVSELYKKPFRIVIIFLLNLLVVFGVNRFDIKVEIFTVFVPLILTILFIEEYKTKKWKDILINFLIYLGIFSLNALLLYKQIEILDREEFLNNSQILFFNLKTVSTDIIVSIFAMGFLYSVVKNLKYKIAVVDMFRYFKEKSSRILVPFYGIIFTLYISVLIYYGLNTDVCYDLLNIFFLFFVVTFICFLMLVFKNFLISDKKDEVTYRLREKSLGFYIRYIGILIGLIIVAGIIISGYIMITSMMRKNGLFLMITGGIIALLLVVIVEILLLNMLIKIYGKAQTKPMNFKKFFNVLAVNIIGLLFLGIAIFINYTIDMNILIINPLVLHILLAVMINFIGLIINFQVLGVLVDKKFMTALKDGFIKTKKFLNPKVLIILIGEDIFLMINILNGTFTGLIYFINFIVSLYLINFYFVLLKGKSNMIGTLENEAILYVEVIFWSGKRKNPPSLISGKYCPHFVVKGKSEYLGICFLDGTECFFNKIALGNVQPLYPDTIDYSSLADNTEFLIYEEEKLVGKGKILGRTIPHKVKQRKK